LIGLITHDIVGKELMAGAVGSVYFMISIPMTMGPPVAGKDSYSEFYVDISCL
jgi:MCP family monocarboxylic acid transporter-like MFS transporter 10